MRKMDAPNMFRSKLMGTSSTKRNLDFQVPEPTMPAPSWPDAVSEITLIQAHRSELEARKREDGCR